MPHSNSRPVITWLFTGCALIFIMTIVGGITRLTGSGLSITEWRPIMGAVPPMNADEWQHAFDLYKQSPQFIHENNHFGIDEFKTIFFWEYLHRLIGRIIGLVFLIPFAWFWYKKNFSPELFRKCVFIFLLGGLQGLIGWLMVKSGLIDNPRVSHYRLALHLLTAFLTFGFIFHTALTLIPPKQFPVRESKTLANVALLFGGLVVFQIIYGAFVAGLHAGKIYNTFPRFLSRLGRHHVEI